MKDISVIPANPSSNYGKILLSLLVATYFFGVPGLLLPPTIPYFKLLTPFNLVLSAFILFSFHSQWNVPFIWFCLISFLTGIFVEVAGVATGIIFGDYSYGPTLGIKVLEVPLIIGLNWTMLVYASGVICNKLALPYLLKALCASLLMVLLDVFIEPVAIRYDFWSWKNDLIPLQNYVAWFIISFVLHTLFFLLPFDKKNQAAKYLYLSQLIFFIILCLFTIY